MWTLFLIAVRSLAQHRKRTLLLGGAIAAVTALLIIMMGLSTGIRETMLRSATTLVTGHVNVAGFYKVTAGQSAPVVTGYKAVMDVIRKEVPELDYAVVRGRGWGKIISDTGTMQVGISGITIAEEPGFKSVVKVEAGDIGGLAEPKTVLIFEEQAKKLEVTVGDTVTLSTTTTRGIANTVDVRIVAIARNVGLMSSWNIFIPSDTLRSLYQINDDTVGAIYLYLKDIKSIPAVQERLRTQLVVNGYSLMDPNPVAFFMKFESVNREDWTGQKLDVTDWEDEISFMTWTLQTLDGLTFILISILVIIIVIGIMNTMWIAIRERTREIGTLRAIGMQRRQVLTMFLLEALVLGLAGTASGAALGSGVSGVLNLMVIKVPTAVQLFLMSDTLSLSIRVLTAMGAVLSLTAVTTIAAVYPAYRAARLRPVTAMHHVG